MYEQRNQIEVGVDISYVSCIFVHPDLNLLLAHLFGVSRVYLGGGAVICKKSPIPLAG